MLHKTFTASSQRHADADFRSTSREAVWRDAVPADSRRRPRQPAKESDSMATRRDAWSAETVSPFGGRLLCHVCGNGLCFISSTST
jgi:hypothetical protein